MSITQLILQASLPVQLILLLLLFMSLFSWYWIFRKGLQIRNARFDTREFENIFWREADLLKLHTRLSSHKDAGALERIFMAGFTEYYNDYRDMPKDLVSNSVRVVMRSTYQQEMDSLEDHLGGLASIGSVSPYVGLFGTVWGIMQAFRGLANTHQATLAQVAPGIAEALVATALGLFAAIPAVLAYNHFTQEVDRLRIRFDTFISELTVLIQRESK